jgi:hypothetical protein
MKPKIRLNYTNDSLRSGSAAMLAVEETETEAKAVETPDTCQCACQPRLIAALTNLLTCCNRQRQRQIKIKTKTRREQDRTGEDTTQKDMITHDKTRLG